MLRPPSQQLSASIPAFVPTFGGHATRALLRQFAAPLQQPKASRRNDAEDLQAKFHPSRPAAAMPQISDHPLPVPAVVPQPETAFLVGPGLLQMSDGRFVKVSHDFTAAAPHPLMSHFPSGQQPSDDVTFALVNTSTLETLVQYFSGVAVKPQSKPQRQKRGSQTSFLPVPARVLATRPASHTDVGCNATTAAEEPKRKSRSLWQADEDLRLRQLVVEFGEGNWSEIAGHMENRDSKACRERYVNYLATAPNTGKKWTDEEKLRLFELTHKHARPPFAAIAKEFQRNTAEVKNQWYSHVRTVVRKVKRDERQRQLLIMAITQAQAQASLPNLEDDQMSQETNSTTEEVMKPDPEVGVIVPFDVNAADDLEEVEMEAEQDADDVGEPPSRRQRVDAGMTEIVEPSMLFQ